MIDVQETEIQVVPSLKFGLKLLVFIKKNQEKKNKKNVVGDDNEGMFLIVDEQLESSMLS